MKEDKQIEKGQDSMKITHIPRNRDLHKRKVAAYCRVSTLLEEQEDSFEFQKIYYMDVILSREDWEFAGIYSDEKSGTKAENRKGFQQLIKDALAGNIDYILCKSVSRFSRNMVDCKKYVQLLLGNGVNIYFEKENMDTSDPSCSMMFSFLSTVSQDESRSISDNVKWAYRERFKRGEYNLGNNRVLGYDSINGKLVPNQDADIVQIIFTQFAAGKSLIDITNKLLKMGVVGRNGKPLTKEGIRYILFNETYVGDKLLQKRAPKNFLTKQPEKGVIFESRYLVGDHEAIIDRDLWNAVQARLGIVNESTDSTVQTDNNHTVCAGSVAFVTSANNSSSDRSDRCSNHKHPLFGKVICADCGSLMTRRTFRASSKAENRGDTYKVWTCKERYKGRKGNGCMMRHVREDEVLEAIRNELQSQSCQAGQAGQDGNTQSIEDSFADIDYIKVGQDEVTVIWKKTGK